MNALGVYVFGGGFTLGVKKHFTPIANLEGDGGYGAASVRRNQPEVPVFFGPSDWPLRELRALYPDLDLVYGNPPCAAWSPIGRVVNAGSSELQWSSDPRVNCIREMFAVLELLRPKVWAWESVPQAFTRGRSLVDALSERASALGYASYYVLHNAMYLGAPQHRKRFFCVFSKVAIDWHCPFTEPETLGSALARMKLTARSDLAVPSSNVKPALLRFTKEGVALRATFAEYVTKTGDVNHQKQGFATKKAAWDKPSPAMVGPRIFHPKEPRLFSVAESLHICGFPTDYIMSGGSHARVHEIARGILPTVGTWLGKNVRAAVERAKSVDPGRRFVVDFFSPPGRIEEVAS